MDNDFEKKTLEDDATSLDYLFDNANEEPPKATASSFTYASDNDPEEDPFSDIKESKKGKKGKHKSQKPKKKKTGIIIIAALLVLAILAGVYFFFFSAKKYNVSFLNEDGSEIETVKVKEGSSVTLIEAPEKEGFVFKEWQLNGKAYDVSKPVTSDISLKAFYKKAVKVTFLNEDGTEFTVVTIGEGETVEKPEKDPEAKDKAFVTWLTEDEKVFSFLTEIKEDLTLIAKMKPYIKPTGLAYANPTYRIYIKEEKHLPAVVTPGNTTETVMYSSSDPEIFTVDNKGTVKGLKEGTATLTAKVEGLVATTTVTVEPKPVEGLTLQEGNSVRVGKNKSITLHPVIVPEDATYKDVTFTCSDESVASISKEGVVKGLKKGTCTVTATAHNGVSYWTNVEVFNDVERVELVYSDSTDTLYFGENTLTVTLKYYPEDADVDSIEWSYPPNNGEKLMFATTLSGDKKTLTVSAGNGVVGYGSGATYTISATVNTTTCSNPRTITAKERVIEVNLISVSEGSNLRIAKGSILTIHPVITPSNATNQALNYYSSDPSIASIDGGGNITGNEAGTCTITISSSNGVSCTVNVEIYEE